MVTCFYTVYQKIVLFLKQIEICTITVVAKTKMARDLFQLPFQIVDSASKNELRAIFDDKLCPISAKTLGLFCLRQAPVLETGLQGGAL